MKQRADLALVARGLATSRERAQAMILAGRVFCGERRVDKASWMVMPQDSLILRGEEQAWASRGALKLEKALQAFEADVSGLVAMDIGAASGGFTDVLLRNGAAHVYAIDVGYGQLDWRLRQDERVTVMERTNARLLKAEQFSLRPALTVMDVSFISIRLILPAAMDIMGEQGRFLTLIKPQFEAGRGQVGKHGVVREADTHVRVLREIRDFADRRGWRVQGMTFSPVKGPKGNIEFLADIVRGPDTSVDDTAIVRLVEQAHTELR
ncbi:MAG: TlyA family RNA methyltransferase [Christensenellales bacterium]|jgi:23S rRNA (cytidine1920-2'-O)/16S rRNA (cytidine1409-2'-O)-methyltransferase